MIDRLCICGQEVYGKPLVTSTQFCCELKTDPKNSLFFKKKDYYGSCMESKTKPNECRSREISEEATTSLDKR